MVGTIEGRARATAITASLQSDFVPADGTKTANWKKRRLRYVAVFGSSQTSHCLNLALDYIVSGFHDRAQIALSRHGRRNGSYTVAIQDTGPGISAADQA